MSSLNFIGGEKGGVGKSVVARVLAQYFIDSQQPFTGFDTDRSHTTFTRFYQSYASPVIVDSFESLDAIAQALDEAQGSSLPNIIVDLAAQTAAPMARWIQESDLFTVMADMGVKVNFWHVADAGKDSVDLLNSLIDTYGAGPNYVVVKNLGRGSDFSQLEGSDALKKALEFGTQVVSLGQLQESSMRKIDRQDASFWAAVNQTSGPYALGLLERQRAKHWLKKTYETLRSLPL
jgi:hypothetical protein